MTVDHGRSGFAFGLVLTFLSTATLVQESLYYVNGRFGFGADIPAGFSPDEPLANDDGLQFDSREGDAVITASTVRNEVRDTMASFVTLSNDACVDHRPSYLDVHADWGVLSCPMPDGRTLYQRSALRGPTDDAVFTTVRMTYPSKDRDRWDAFAVAVTRSMKPALGG